MTHVKVWSYCGPLICSTKVRYWLYANSLCCSNRNKCMIKQDYMQCIHHCINNNYTSGMWRKYIKIIDCILFGQVKGFNSALTSIMCQSGSYRMVAHLTCFHLRKLIAHVLILTFSSKKTICSFHSCATNNLNIWNCSTHTANFFAYL